MDRLLAMFTALFFAVCVYLLVATSVEAQNCAKRDLVVERLSGKYLEHQHATGTQGENAILEIHFSLDTGTFTVLVTNAHGVSCIVATGENFELHLPPASAVPGSAL